MQTKNSASVLTVLLALCGVFDARPPDFTIQFNYHEATAAPVGVVERRVGHHEVGLQVLVQVVVETVGLSPTEVGIDAPNGEVHLGQPPSRGFGS